MKLPENLDLQVKSKIEKWMNSSIDEAHKSNLRDLIIKNDVKELTECFYKDLEFGTGGLRGIMGVGSNRMNKYTVGMATQGLANYLLKSFPNEDISVAIAYDSRNNSDVFADIVSDIFSANGIKVYLFESLRPTPELSFAIRELKCKSGVVLTASHNPKEYNGYKAYWDDGGQVIAPHDKNIIREVQSIQSFDDVKWQRNNDLVESIGQNIDNKYLDHLMGLVVDPELIKRQSDLKILFSPIHGTGVRSVGPALEKAGFKNVRILKSQAKPDGNFPTVIYPNPEEKEAMSLALEAAKDWDADLIMATDPDADRVGIGVKNDQGQFVLLNGNQTGSLLIYYLLEAWKRMNKYKGNEFICKTIVTTDLIIKIANAYNVNHYETLTGFKYIASLIKGLEGKEQFIAGGEESYGYLIGDAVRDKDAVASCLLISEMTAWAKDSGISLYDMMIDMYVKFGFYKENLISITKKGKEGAEEIASMMENYRNNPPKSLGGSEVIEMKDYKSGLSKNLISGEQNKMNFESSNVLQFITLDGSKISARPSGTEPKIKFYFSVNTRLDNKSNYSRKEQELKDKIEKISSDLGLN
ncbi:phospho-sugar mutase [Hyphobacterium sp. CCMP332]|nr:phospho-sugar mutase [Hyphobacterium sp. CCMP332]